MIRFRQRSYMNRKGNASLELALFLPLLTIFLVASIAVAAGMSSLVYVEMDSRYETWKLRHTPWKSKDIETTDLNVSPRSLAILNGQIKSPVRSMITHESTWELPEIPLDILPETVTKKHAIWAGTWDYREIEFPQQSSHPRLVLMDRVNAFSSSKVPRKAFVVLGGK